MKRQIIFIHGFLESPDQFDELVALAQYHGYEAQTLLLPGHGGTSSDFAMSHRSQWQESLQAVIDQLPIEQPLLLVGHSMGALLSIQASISNESRIQRLFLLATPLKLRLTGRGLRTALNVAWQKNQDDVFVQSMRSATSVQQPQKIVGYLAWMPRYFDLFALIVQARRQSHKLKTPYHAIFFGQDEFVAPKSRKYFADEQITILPQSGHFHYEPAEATKIAKQFQAWLTQ